MAYIGRGVTGKVLAENTGGGTLPAFGTAVVSGGGTGDTSFTSYGIITGGTTSTGALQVITPGTSGYLLRSGGSSALPTWASAPSVGSSLVLLSSQTASNVASVAFTSLINATYDKYLLIYDNYQPVTSLSDLEMLVSTNNGTSYIATNYQSGINGWFYNSATWGNASSTTYMQLSTGIDNTKLSGGYFFLFNVQNGGAFQLEGHSLGINSGNLSTDTLGATNTAVNVNAFELLTTSGNINTGTFTLYGILE